MVGAYQIRGLARIRQNKFDEAIEDYKTAIKYDPENVVLWHNLSLCHIQKEDYEAAKEDLGTLLTIAPRYTRAYLMRGEVSLKQNDTIQALRDLTKPSIWTVMTRMDGGKSHCTPPAGEI